MEGKFLHNDNTLNLIRHKEDTVNDNGRTEYRNAPSLAESTINDTKDAKGFSYADNLSYLKSVLESKLNGDSYFVKEADIINQGYDTKEELKANKSGYKQRKAMQAAYKTELLRVNELLAAGEQDLDEMKDIELNILKIEGLNEDNVKSEVYETTLVKYDILAIKEAKAKLLVRSAEAAEAAEAVDEEAEEEVVLNALIDNAKVHIDKYYEDKIALRGLALDANRNDLLQKIVGLRNEFLQATGDALYADEKLNTMSRKQLLLYYKNAKLKIDAENKRKQLVGDDPDMVEIDKLLKTLNLPAQKRQDKTDRDLILSKRQINHHFITYLNKQHKFLGDSTEMKAVKNRLTILEELLTDKEDFNAWESIDTIIAAYQLAIAQCRQYCDNRYPGTDTGYFRWNLVNNMISKLVSEESQMVLAKRLIGDVAREDKTVNRIVLNNPEDLFVLADMHAMANDQKIERLEENSISATAALTLEDFAALIGTKNRGEIEFKDGKIQINNKSYFAQTEIYEIGSILLGTDSKATIENHKLRERLYELAKDRVGNTTDYQKRILNDVKNELGLNDGATKKKPMSRASFVNAIQIILCENANYNTEIYDYENKVTANNTRRVEHKPELPISVEATDRYKIAKKLNDAFSYKDNNRDYSFFYALSRNTDTEHIKGRIKEMISKSRDLGYKGVDDNEHNLDNLAKGGIMLVADKIFDTLIQTYNYAKNLNINNDEQNQAVNVDNILLPGNTELIDKITAVCLSRYFADNEKTKENYDLELDEIARNEAFRAVNKQDIQSAYDIFENSYLSECSTEGIDIEIERRALSVKAWNKENARDAEGKNEELIEATKLFKELCDSFREAKKLQETALKEGLTEDEANRLCELGGRIQILVAGEDSKKVELVALNLKGTVYERGYLEARAAIADRSGNSSYALSANVIGNVSKNNEKNPAQGALAAKKFADNDAKIERLTESEAALAYVLLNQKKSFDLVTDADSAKDLETLRKTLIMFPVEGVFKRTVNVFGASGELYQKNDGSLYFIANKQAVKLNKSAKNLAADFEMDMVEHAELFDQFYINDLLNGLDVSGNNPGILLRSRNLCIKYLVGRTKMPDTFFANITSAMAKNLAITLLSGDTTPEYVKYKVSTIDSSAHINSMENLELINILQRGHTNVTYRVQREEAKVNDWTDDQKLIIDFLSDLIYSKDTWNADLNLTKPEKRLSDVFMNHYNSLLVMAKNPQIVTQTFSKMPMDTEELYNGLNEVLNSIRAMMMFGANEQFINNAIRTQLSTPEGIDKLLKLDKDIEAAVLDASDSVQQNITEAARRAFPANQMQQRLQYENPNEPGITPEEKERRQEATTKQLNKLMEDSMKGSQGQGRFIKEVLSNYFISADTLDKRAMIASALRNSTPKTEIPAGTSDEEREKILNREYGEYLGGVLKGAGPLLQKLMQGIPENAVPSEIAVAISDMKSKLAPIPEEIVKAQLQNIIVRSNGRIENVVVDKALGAASVGQTFLCKLKLAGVDEPKEVVVKLLRPDVRNRMMREKEIMLYCAKRTDDNVNPDGTVKEGAEKGGMEATYEGQLERIEEELDLTIEAKNVQQGAVYDKGFTNVRAMKLEESVEPTTNSLVLEMAKGTTVDRYITDLRNQMDTMLLDFAKKDDEGRAIIDENGEYVLNSLNAENGAVFNVVLDQVNILIEQAIKRQKHIVALVENWCTEGIYGGGFYHGDLHAGNIMIDDDGLTLIDFGNATKLSEVQMMHVTRMVMAAAIGNADIFQESFHTLLKNTTKEKYKAKQDELKAIIKEVLDMGTQQASGQRIAVILSRAQNIGLELPSEIFNFSQSQLRLQNTLEDINNCIEQLQNIRVKLNDLNGTNIDNDLTYDLYGKQLTKVGTTYANLDAALNGIMGIVNSGYVDEDKFAQDYKNLKTDEFMKAYVSQSVKDAVFGVASIATALDTIIADSAAMAEADEGDKRILEVNIRNYVNYVAKHFERIMPLFKDNNSAIEYREAVERFLTTKQYTEQNVQFIKNAMQPVNNSPIKVYVENLVTTLDNREASNTADGDQFVITEEIIQAGHKAFIEFDNAVMNKFPEYDGMVASAEEFERDDSRRLEDKINNFYLNDDSIPVQLKEELRNSFENYKREVANKKEQFPQADKKTKREIRAKVSNAKFDYFRVCKRAAYEKAKANLAVINKPRSTEEIKSFANVMGEIICSNLKTSVRKLGKINAIKNKDRM